jgi:hypothetical protein
MIEQNSTFWSGGTLDGKKEVFLTPGLVLGSFPLDRATPSCVWRWCADRRDAVPPVQPSMDSLGALPVLSSLSGSARECS